MVVFRCTRELLARLKQPPVEPDDASTTRLGDWYVALLRVGPRRYLLAVSERTRLPVLLPARDGRGLAAALSAAVSRVLLAIGVPETDVAAECAEMSAGSFGPTRSRSVLGTMNDYSIGARIRLREEPGTALDEVALWLAETPIMKPFNGASASDETRKTFGLEA
jgi:hypothetical protein